MEKTAFNGNHFKLTEELAKVRAGLLSPRLMEPTPLVKPAVPGEGRAGSLPALVLAQIGGKCLPWEITHMKPSWVQMQSLDASTALNLPEDLSCRDMTHGTDPSSQEPSQQVSVLQRKELQILRLFVLNRWDTPCLCPHVTLMFAVSPWEGLVRVHTIILFTAVH